MDVVFLDANVLFSAAYRSEAGLQRLWDLKGVELVSSMYAVEEAAAIGARASHLLTGDITHFGHLLGRTIADVTILTPSQYLSGPLGEDRAAE